MSSEFKIYSEPPGLSTGRSHRPAGKERVAVRNGLERWKNIGWRNKSMEFKL